MSPVNLSTHLPGQTIWSLCARFLELRNVEIWAIYLDRKKTMSITSSTKPATRLALFWTRELYKSSAKPCNATIPKGWNLTWCRFGRPGWLGGLWWSCGLYNEIRKDFGFYTQLRIFRDKGFLLWKDALDGNLRVSPPNKALERVALGGHPYILMILMADRKNESNK